MIKSKQINHSPLKINMLNPKSEDLEDYCPFQSSDFQVPAVSRVYLHTYPTLHLIRYPKVGPRNCIWCTSRENVLARTNERLDAVDVIESLVHWVNPTPPL